MKNRNIVSELEGALPTLTGAYLAICTYVLEHVREVPNMSTEELALACGVSEASVVRFARKMGMDGYRSFKLALTADLAFVERNGIALADIHAQDDPGEVLGKLTSYTITSLENTRDVLDRAELARAVDIIDTAYMTGRRIYLAGLGATSTVVRAFAVKLMRLGIQTTYFSDYHLQLESMLNIREGDVLVCFTVLGRSAENNEVIDIARARGCEVVVVTQSGNNELAKKATCLLLTSCVENNLRLASQTGLIVQMLIADALFTSLALRHLPKTREDVGEMKRVFRDLGHYASA